MGIGVKPDVRRRQERGSRLGTNLKEVLAVEAEREDAIRVVILNAEKAPRPSWQREIFAGKYAIRVEC